MVGCPSIAEKFSGSESGQASKDMLGIIAISCALGVVQGSGALFSEAAFFPIDPAEIGFNSLAEMAATRSALLEQVNLVEADFVVCVCVCLSLCVFFVSGGGGCEQGCVSVCVFMEEKFHREPSCKSRSTAGCFGKCGWSGPPGSWCPFRLPCSRMGPYFLYAFHATDHLLIFTQGMHAGTKEPHKQKDTLAECP